MRTQVFLLLFCFQASLSFAQLDSIHWIPPMHARSELGPQFLYMSTPETTPFAIIIRDGSGKFLDSVIVSNAQPVRWSLGSSSSSFVLVDAIDLQLPVKNKGLVLSGTHNFYVNFRFYSSSGWHAADLTCKGRSALGTEFRIAHLYQSQNANGRSNFVGVLATEDSTLVTLSEFEPDIVLNIAGILTPTSAQQSVLLQSGESLVFSHYEMFGHPANGLIGARVSSNKPIALNCGSWTGASVDNSNDVGMDQVAPFDQVGEEYVLCKGNGGQELETPIVIAHLDNTAIWLNGSTSPVKVLNAGQYYRIPTSSYSAVGNMYIQCSKPAFVYQLVGGVPTGNDATRTGGMIFVPPINCAIPNAVDNIYHPNRIGDVVYDGGLMIVAMKDSLVRVKIDNNLIAIGNGDPVPGNPDFVTYRRLDLFRETQALNTASIVAKGAVQVAMFGRNGAAGYGSFYSGFSKTAKADVSLNITGDGVCPDTIVASGLFDGIQWYYADSLLTYGPDSFFIAYAPGLYTARAYLGVCRRTNYSEDTISANFISPVFPFEAHDPTCFDYSDGQIQFGTPSGGLAPYQFSVNQGHSFTNSATYVGLHAGTYHLVVRDSTGCYNRPLELEIGQPDSLSVQIEIVKMEEPVKPSDLVELEAVPNRMVEFAEWLPANTGIQDFLRLQVKPEETTDYTVIVTDAEGCTASDLVRIILEPNVFAPNVLKPESASGNEFFTLFSKDPIPVNWLRIYDRWGSLVFENNGFFTNDRSAGWDGSFRGKPLSPGVFVFQTELEYAPGRLIRLQGDITLIR